MISSSARHLLLAIALRSMLSGGPTPAGPPSPPDGGVLAASLLDVRVRADRFAREIAALEPAVRENDETFHAAELKVQRAYETNNEQARLVPEAEMKRARAEGKRLAKSMARLVQSRTDAENATRVMTTMLVEGRRPDPGTAVLGVVLPGSEDAAIRHENGKKLALPGGNPGFLVTGESVSTAAGRAEVRFLRGSGLARLGGRTRLALERDDAGGQAARLAEGRTFIALEPARELEARLSAAAEGADAGLRASLDSLRGLPDPEAVLGGTLSLGIPGGTCAAAGGARFSVEIGKDGAAEIAVHEGAVEAGLADGAKRAIAAGTKVVVSKAGIGDPAPIGRFDAWWNRD